MAAEVVDDLDHLDAWRLSRALAGDASRERRLTAAFNLSQLLFGYTRRRPVIKTQRDLAAPPADASSVKAIIINPSTMSPGAIACAKSKTCWMVLENKALPSLNSMLRCCSVPICLTNGEWWKKRGGEELEKQKAADVLCFLFQEPEIRLVVMAAYPGMVATLCQLLDDTAYMVRLAAMSAMTVLAASQSLHELMHSLGAIPTVLKHLQPPSAYAPVAARELAIDMNAYKFDALACQFLTILAINRQRRSMTALQAMTLASDHLVRMVVCAADSREPKVVHGLAKRCDNGDPILFALNALGWCLADDTIRLHCHANEEFMGVVLRMHTMWQHVPPTVQGPIQLMACAVHALVRGLLYGEFSTATVTGYHQLTGSPPAGAKEEKEKCTTAPLGEVELRYCSVPSCNDPAPRPFHICAHCPFLVFSSSSCFTSHLSYCHLRTLSC